MGLFKKVGKFFGGAGKLVGKGFRKLSRSKVVGTVATVGGFVAGGPAGAVAVRKGLAVARAADRLTQGKAPDIELTPTGGVTLRGTGINTRSVNKSTPILKIGGKQVSVNDIKIPKKVNLKQKVGKIKGAVVRAANKEIKKQSRFLVKLGDPNDKRRAIDRGPVKIISPGPPQRPNVSGTTLGKAPTAQDTKLVAQATQGANKSAQAIAQKTVADKLESGEGLQTTTKQASIGKTIGIMGLALSLWSALTN